MSEEVQPGVRIDAGIWKRFREDIKTRHGHVRGHLRSELETAIQQYLDDNSDPTLARIETKVDYLAGELDVDVSDAPPRSHGGDEHTHAEPDAPDSRPAPQSSTDKKTRWLASCVKDQVADGFGEIPKSILRDTVKEEYGFRSDTAERYVDELTTHFDLVDHPHADPLLVTNERREELVEQKREQLKDELTQA